MHLVLLAAFQMQLRSNTAVLTPQSIPGSRCCVQGPLCPGPVHHGVPAGLASLSCFPQSCSDISAYLAAALPFSEEEPAAGRYARLHLGLYVSAWHDTEAHPSSQATRQRCAEERARALQPAHLGPALRWNAGPGTLLRLRAVCCGLFVVVLGFSIIWFISAWLCFGMLCWCGDVLLC